MGFSVTIALLLLAPPYVLAAFVAVGSSYWADKVHHRTPFIFAHSIIAIIGFALVAADERGAQDFRDRVGALPGELGVEILARAGMTLEGFHGEPAHGCFLSIEGGVPR